MTAYGVSIRIDTATASVERIRAALAARTFRPAIGEAAKLTLQTHFRDKEADPDSHKTAARLSAQPTGVYSQFANATAYVLLDTGVGVSITHPAIQQRIRGGEIKPVNKQWLTIPAIGAAYGKSVADFGDVLQWRWYRSKSGELKGMLVLDADVKKTKTVRRKGKEKKIDKVKYRSGVYFWAVKSVNQAPDPSVLPTDEDLLTGIDAAVGSWLEEQIDGR